MALSDEEQKLLEQMEAALAADDPRLAHTLRGNRTPRTLQRKRAAVAGFGFLAGCALLIAGMRLHWVVSVLGFVVMLVSTVVAISSYRPVDTKAPASPGRPKSGARPRAADSSFMDKMEERWNRRQDDGR